LIRSGYSSGQLEADDLLRVTAERYARAKKVRTMKPVKNGNSNRAQASCALYSRRPPLFLRSPSGCFSNCSDKWQVWKAPIGGGSAGQETKQGEREASESPDGRFVYLLDRGQPCTVAGTGLGRGGAEGLGSSPARLLGPAVAGRLP
jgi:hypothetical protein